MNNSAQSATAVSLIILLAGLLITSSPASAGELKVQAPVIDVEPLTEPAMAVEHCDGNPGPAATLAETLAWDLGLNCHTEYVESATVTGYRVFYRWDDRVYSQVMSSAPGATVPLKVRLN